MINFTIGPVQTDIETQRIGAEQIPYFRTPEFSAVMKENERLMCQMFDAPEQSRVVFLTGSGTASMEGGVMNLFNQNDKVLVVNGGSFGHRLVELCQIHDITFTEIHLDYGNPLTKDILIPFENKGYTGMMLQLCETSTGILYDMKMVGDFCKRNNIFLFVDAVSGFLADEFSMKSMNVNAAFTGSQKALSLPPSMSFTVLDPIAQKRCVANKVKSMYFNYADYLKNGERGQTPFTPAVATLLQLNDKLKRIANNGGVRYVNEVIKHRADYFRSKIKSLPLKVFTPVEASSNCVTALSPINNKIGAYRIFEIIKDEYGIWVCPNGGDLVDKVFRVGHIGCISDKDIDILVSALYDLQKRNII